MTFDETSGGRAARKSSNDTGPRPRGIDGNAKPEGHDEEARAAGRIGGLAVSQDREYMSWIGRIGGKARHQKT